MPKPIPSSNTIVLIGLACWKQTDFVEPVQGSRGRTGRGGFIIAIRLLLIISMLLSVYPNALSQNAIEQRLARIEAKLDTLLALQSGSLPPQTGYAVLKDDSNLQWGIASGQGIILNKGYYLINYAEDFDIPYWVAYLSRVGLKCTSAGRVKTGQVNAFTRDNCHSPN